MNTLIVEKAHFSRNKLNGGLITLKTKKLYKKNYAENSSTVEKTSTKFLKIKRNNIYIVLDSLSML